MIIKAAKKYWLEVLLVTPLLAYLLGFTLWPIIHSTIYAFTNYINGDFPSLVSFEAIITNFQFKEAVFNTLFITFFSLFFELVLGLGLALLLLEKFRGRKFFRALMLLPLGIPTIVVASNMRYIFDTNGFLNEIFYRLHLIEIPINWLGGGILTLFTVVIADMWKVTPLVMLILLAGIESIPKEVLEAAQIDGASYLRRLWYIILPFLRPFITMALIIRGIDAFRIFEMPLALTGRVVPVLGTFSYFEYREYGNIYTSAAAAAILMLMIMVAITIYLKVVKQDEVAL
ncbi:MAG: sugar ABC transporter permease [Candidatus Saganbacteria bacterium]|nr:sugar ABC transporter permease [Candidatus Saganbacteria bacterium]